MKKIIGFLLLVLIVTTSALALADDEIVLPYGLEFGMSYSEALAVSNFQEGENHADMVRIEALGLNQAAYLIQSEVEIGEYESFLYVYFHDNGVKQLWYSIGRAIDADGDDVYQSIENTLTERHGASLDPENITHEFALHNDDSGIALHYIVPRDVAPTENTFRILDSSVRRVNLSSGGCVYINHYNTQHEVTAGVYDFILSQNLITYTYYDSPFSDDSDTASADF